MPRRRMSLALASLYKNFYIGEAMTTRVRRSSGNVFRDLDFQADDAAGHVRDIRLPNLEIIPEFRG